MSELLFKICPEPEWREAQARGAFLGSAVDLADGYIHLSNAGQVRETASKHFAGKAGLVLVAIDAERLGGDLRWERSRGGALFPHLYAPLETSAVRWVRPLPLSVEGGHLFPALER